LICALSGASAEKRRVHGKDPDPLYITGPPGICEFVKAAISCSRTVLGLPLVVTELTAPGNGVPGAGADDGAADPRAVVKQTHFAADARQKMFLGERWPDNGAATAPHFKDREGWSAAWDGSLTLPYWTVHREKPRNAGGERGGKSGGLVVRAAPLRHPVPCFGYVIDEPDQAGRIDAERCIELGLPPGKEYARLKAGFDVQTKEGKTITPAMVLGCDRPGRRLCLLGDTCDSIGIARLARGADVLVHESTFAAYKHQEAVYKGHSTSVMAGEFARLIKARNLLLTHFSNRYGTANTRRGGTDGSESSSRLEEEDDIEDDMALPDEAPEDMRAAAQEEFTLVEGLVREAAQAKGDARVVAASDFFVFNVQRREKFDETDDAKGDRDGLFDGPLVAPTLETYEDAKARMDAGVKGYYSQNYGSGERAPQSAQGGYRGRGRSSRTFRGRSESGYAGYPERGGRGGRFARAEDGRFQRRQTYEGEEGRPPARRGALQTKPSLTSRAQVKRAGRAFDAETASIDSASFVRDFNRRGEE
jgi:ribonuclease Z